jgi:hypothetical protein
MKSATTQPKLSDLVGWLDLSHRVRWHQTWWTAKERWETDSQSVYLFDEPGGRRIDTGVWNGGMAPALMRPIASAMLRTSS